MKDGKKPIYIGLPIREALEGSPDSLSGRVNCIVERYMAMRLHVGKPWVHFSETTMHVIREAAKDFRKRNRRPMSSHEIATLDVIVKTYVESKPDYTGDMLRAEYDVRNIGYAARCVLIEELESQ